MKKNHSKLALSFIAGFLLLGLLICAVTSVIGYTQYKSGIEKQYNDKAYEIAKTAESFVDLDTIKEYREALIGFRKGTVPQEKLDALMAEPRYQTAKSQLYKLAKHMNTNDVYIAYLDEEVLRSYAGTKEGWNPIQYMFDNYHIEEESFVLGDESSCNPKSIESVIEILETGVRSEDYFISNGDFGYITSAIHPILDEDGSVLAIVGVETPMTTIEASLQQYLVYAVSFTVILILLLIALYVVILYRRVINPINKVSAAVSNFIENNNTVSESLKEIKTGDEIQTLAESTYKMENDINEYIENITAITAEKERIGAELNVATQIQASMLPCIFPAFPGRKEFDIYATMNPAKEVGGDFYDFFMVDDRHLAIVMADVSGKGVPAALFMVIGKTLINDHTQPGADLGQTFMKVNNMLCNANSEGLFITAFEGVLDLYTGEFTYVNAGHEMPFIARVGEPYKPYAIRAAFVLAGMEGMRYKAGSMILNPGDRVFQYTDGVTEATNAHEELYGMERLENVLNANRDATPAELLPAVKADIDAFVGEAPQFDDITMLSLAYLERMELAEK